MVINTLPAHSEQVTTSVVLVFSAFSAIAERLSEWKTYRWGKAVVAITEMQIVIHEHLRWIIKIQDSRFLTCKFWISRPEIDPESVYAKYCLGKKSVQFMEIYCPPGLVMNLLLLVVKRDVRFMRNISPSRLKQRSFGKKWLFNVLWKEYKEPILHPHFPHLLHCFMKATSSE